MNPTKEIGRDLVRRTPFQSVSEGKYELIQMKEVSAMVAGVGINPSLDRGQVPLATSTMAEGRAGDLCRSQVNMCETAGGEDKETEETRPGQQQGELGELVELVVPF